MKGTTTGPSNPPQAALAPASLDFGSQDLGTTSSPLSITLANTGSADLVVSNLSLSSSQFTVAGPTATTITPGKQAAYSITFSPVAAQSYSGALSFATNMSAATPVLLAGRGRNRVNVSPSNLGLGTQIVNITSGAQTVTVTNTGGANGGKTHRDARASRTPAAGFCHSAGVGAGDVLSLAE